MNEWKKSCPKCGCEQVYSRKDVLMKALRFDTPCNGCKLKTSPATLERRCPKCQIVIVYTQGHIWHRATRENSLCKRCSRLGKTASMTTRQKISALNMGKTLSTATKQKISLSSKKWMDTNRGFLRKPYSLPDGTIVKVQGYENLTLDYLFQKENLQVADIRIITKDKPQIPYEYGGSIHHYIPDVYIPKNNLVVETKSTWTLVSDEEKNKAKIRGCIAAGYEIRMMVWDKKHKLVKDYTFGSTEL